jgi:hypothetical protein
MQLNMQSNISRKIHPNQQWYTFTMNKKKHGVLAKQRIQILQFVGRCGGALSYQYSRISLREAPFPLVNGTQSGTNQNLHFENYVEHYGNHNKP